MNSERLRLSCLAILIFLAALLPRMIGLNDFYTIDEGYHWPGRVERFSEALSNGQWAETNQTGHPGVTTMWLGALGRQLAFAQGITDPGWAGGGAGYLGMLRLPLAAANALMVLIGFLLLIRLFSLPEATLAALFWALSPFLIAHSRLLHLDALVTSFITLCLLAVLVALRQPRLRYRWLIGAGVAAGLAFLTKAPSLILLPVVGLLLLLSGLVHTPGVLWQKISSVIMAYLLWILVALVVILLGWPAMWTDPAGAFGAVLREIIDNGGQPHHSGNYFLGTPVADPGGLFYPAVLLLRTTPLTLIGLILALVWLATTSATAVRQRHWQELLHTERLVFLFVLIFLVAMSLQAKKLDRYLLPIWPASEILAAVAIMRTIERLRPGRRLYWPLVAGAASLIAALTSLPYHPYYLSFYNPLAGGPRVAGYVMLVGIGEGMDEVGTWLSQRPDLQRGDVLSWIPPTLAPFVPKSTLVRDLRPEFTSKASSYAVLYLRSVQHQEAPQAEAVVRASPALHTVMIHGVPYATIHQIPRPYTTAVTAQFDQAIRLRGFSQEVLGSTLVITPSWTIERDHAGGMFVFVHVLDANGQRVGQIDAPLDQGMFATWQAGQQFDAPLPIPLANDLPAGTYRVVIGVYDPQGGRLPLTAGVALPEAINGPHALLLGEWQR